MAYEPLIGQARMAKRMRMEMQCNPQWVLDLAAERDQLRAEVEALRGIQPEAPPRPPYGHGLPRYGLRWNGPQQPVSVPMDDGYWTPWHLANGEVEALRLSQAAADVLAERRRQVEAEGWTPEHDDEYGGCGLSAAAGCYAMYTLAYPAGDPPPGWPWDKSWWKPGDERRNRVKAAALLLAEIERLDRAAMAAKEGV